MSNLDMLINQVTTACPDLATVAHAWFAEPLEDLDSELPAVMIYLAKEEPVSAAQTLRPIQAVRETYGVWLVANKDQFDIQRKALSSALFGFQIDEDHNPVEFVGGSNKDIKGELIWWLEFWSMETHKRA
jgi:hypothetical protein